MSGENANLNMTFDTLITQSSQGQKWGQYYVYKQIVMSNKLSVDQYGHVINLTLRQTWPDLSLYLSQMSSPKW